MKDDFDERDCDVVKSVISESDAFSTGVMMSTLWNQSGVITIDGNSTVTYNEYCPLDQGVHSVTGCTNTAAAQIIYYFIEKGLLDFDLTLSVEDEYISEWNGVTISVKSDGSTPGTISFSQINQKLADYDINSADDAAALLYACGVVQQAGYSKGETGTSWNADLFLRSGFYAVTSAYLGYDEYWTETVGNKQVISEAGYEILIENLLAGRVIGASIPNHAIVIDGYNAETDSFHLNYGWGNHSSTSWYTRSEMNNLGFNYFIFEMVLFS